MPYQCCEILLCTAFTCRFTACVYPHQKAKTNKYAAAEFPRDRKVRRKANRPRIKRNGVTKPRTTGAVCERPIRNGYFPCGESRPLCAPAHEKVGYGRGSVDGYVGVPGSQVRRIALQGLRGRIIPYRTRSHGNRGRFLRCFVVLYGRCSCGTAVFLICGSTGLCGVIS